MLTDEQQQKKKAEAAEARQDVFYMGLAVFGVLTVMTVFMVSPSDSPVCLMRMLIIQSCSSPGWPVLASTSSSSHCVRLECASPPLKSSPVCSNHLSDTVSYSSCAKSL